MTEDEPHIREKFEAFYKCELTDEEVHDLLARTIHQNERLRADREEAHEALVTHAIHMDLDTHKMTCQMCGEEGPISEMVDHEPDCLLASVDTDEEQVERCADCGNVHTRPTEAGL